MVESSMVHPSEALAAERVVREDLEAITSTLAEEFSQLAGKRVLITGGAGFLGYYLVQSALFWNQIQPRQSIDITVFDNYMRGVPDWLTQSAGNPALHLRQQDLAVPLP